MKNSKRKGQKLLCTTLLLVGLIIILPALETQAEDTSATSAVSPILGLKPDEIQGSGPVILATRSRNLLIGPQLAQEQRDAATLAAMSCAYGVYERAMEQLINEANKCACQRVQYSDCSDPNKLGEHILRWEVVLQCRNDLAETIFAAADATINTYCSNKSS